MVPIVKHLDSRPAASVADRIESVACDLEHEHAALTVAGTLRPLVSDHLEPGPALHIDDLAGVPYLDPGVDKSFLQERARLRADDIDIVVTCLAPSATWETYYRHLGLGAPTWLCADAADGTEAVARAAWEDRAVRRELCRAIRRDELRFVHPHMGSTAAWQLADLLRRSTRRKLSVIAPPPGLARLVNDKLVFADIVRRLLGAHFVPPTRQASNFAHLSRLVLEFAPHVKTIVVKLPDSMAAGGTVIVDAAALRDMSLAGVHAELVRRFEGLAWEGSSPLLVGCWETDVHSSPSAQLWIPPRDDGPPVIEGVFEQLLRGAEAEFFGSRAADLPAHVLAQIGEAVAGLGLLFQRLGYVGRCSFDMLLVGPTLASARLEFVECNGRWGGTSLPMTLMNRLFGDWAKQPYVATTIAYPGLDRLTLGQILEAFAPHVYDARTGAGRLIFYSGIRLREGAAVNVLTLGSTVAKAFAFVEKVVRPRLQGLASVGLGLC
jgi:hypothetical protein